MTSLPPWYRSRSVFFLSLVVLLTILLGIGSYQTIQWRRTIAFKTGAARFSLQILLILVADENSNIRSFVATGEPLFVQSYQGRSRQFASTLAQTRDDARLANLSELESDLDVIAALHDRWQREVAEPIVTGRSGKPYLRAGGLGTGLVDRMRMRIAHAGGLAMEALENGIFIGQLITIASIIGIVALTSILGAAAIGSERRRADRERELARRLAASNDELKRQRSSVLALNQLKNDLIAVLAHDIKGPLTSVGGFAELLKDGALQGEQVVDAARMIYSNAQQLTTLADDVLTLSRIEYGELEISTEQIDVVTLVRSVVSGYLITRPINVTTSAEHAFVLGDADRLRQVIENLLRNAIKYSPASKPIDVTVEVAAEHIRISIRDYGMGIPPEDIPRLFRRFARASNARTAKIPGTGIGLFIVKNIVELHGGTVDVESTVGDGSCFTVTLPSIETATSRRTPCVTILTTDDDLSGFAAYELRSRGYRVRQVRSLVDLAQKGRRASDVVVVDSSLATASDVRSLLPNDGIQLIGLGTDSSDRIGWDATLSQPFLVSELIDAINHVETNTVPKTIDISSRHL